MASEKITGCAYTVPGPAAKIAAMRYAIREIREKKGLTQQQVADRAGLTMPFISMLERGKRRMNEDNLQAIADALDVNPRDLYQSDMAQFDQELQSLSPEAKEQVEALVHLLYMQTRR
jgi:transcriptional regulator with XRE-family HTH domain